MSKTPVITDMKVIPCAGYDSMLLSLSGAHGPLFTRNIVIITDNSGSGEILDSGELKMGDCSLFVKESRYGLINDIASARLMGEEAEAQELLEQYLMTEWMTDGLFQIKGQ